MKKYLGIDIGGTNTKFGIVNEAGDILEKVKYSTAELSENGEYPKEFVRVLRLFLEQNQDTEKFVGIGIPGILSKDRKSTLELPNIPSLSYFPLADLLATEFPDHTFLLENDANAAALGEYYFSKDPISDTYIFLTLGTGIGGAAIINKEIFKGGHGNGMEVGHIFASGKKTVENFIGKKGTVALALKYLDKNKEVRSVLREVSKEELNVKHIVKAAKKGDKIALKVYKKFGKVLGSCIVSTIRTLDIHTIIIGGGVSETLEFIEKPMYKVIQNALPPYYTKDLTITLASLANEAGIIGAASLAFAKSTKG